MWLSNKKLLAEYEAERMKQYCPYQYYLEGLNDKENQKQIVDNKGEHENVPLICYKEQDVVLSSENDEHVIYECGDYFIYESKKGTSSLAEKAKLVTIGDKLNADLIYSDTDHITKEGVRHNPFFKPDYSIDTFKCFDYYSEFYAVKKMKSKMDIALLENITHVTEVLFHWKCEQNAEGIQLLHEKDNKSYLTDDLYLSCSELDIIKNQVTVIIPSKDNPKLVRTCLEGIKNAIIKSRINRIKVVVIDNGSEYSNKEEITCVIKGVNTDNLGIIAEYIYEPMEFNFSLMCNIGAKHMLESDNSYLLFMNDDIEITDDLFLLKLLYFARMEHVGAVGCKLLYPNMADEKTNIIQHIGITCMKYAGPSHKLSTFSDNEMLYFGKNRGVHNVLAVTAACLMVSAEKYFKIGGFYDKMKVGYNDVDLCISLYENGYQNIVNNDCKLIHHESISRGSDAASEKKLIRLDEERNMLYERHPFLLSEGDPFYNPNLAEDFLDYRVDVIPDFERRNYVSSEKMELVASIEKIKAKTKEAYKHLHFSIDSVNKNRAYIEVNGWALINKKPNYLYDSYIVVTDKNGMLHVYEVAKVKRTDVAAIFPEATYSEIAGFMSRIPLATLSYNEAEIIELTGDSIREEIQIGVLVINKKTGKKYYAG